MLNFLRPYFIVVNTWCFNKNNRCIGRFGMLVKYFRWFAVFIPCLFLFGCAGIDQGLKHIADSVAPVDIVTGKRLLNPESEEAEIQRSEKQRDEILNDAVNNGFAVDADVEMLSRLNQMMKNIASISHRPNLPWEVHLIESPEVNAFTVGGGKIFFYRGFFGGLVDPKNDNEIAAIMAHEMGHNVARHAGKTQGMELASQVSKGVKKSTNNQLFHASYTTIHEDEADRIGMLYMTLAGYDPQATSPIWNRANEKDGSDPGSFAYDHSLNTDRANKTAQLAITAMQYFKGQGEVNYDYQKILATNELLPKESLSSVNDGGVVATLSAALDNYGQYLETENEKLSRQLQMQQAEFTAVTTSNNAAALSEVSFQIQDTNTGFRGIFGKFQNNSNQIMTGATITVYYLNAAGQAIYSEPVSLGALYLFPGQVASWQTLLKVVPDSLNIAVKPTEVQLQ